jgi:hypothetical protein
MAAFGKLHSSSGSVAQSPVRTVHNFENRGQIADIRCACEPVLPRSREPTFRVDRERGGSVAPLDGAERILQMRQGARLAASTSWLRVQAGGSI